MSPEEAEKIRQKAVELLETARRGDLKYETASDYLKRHRASIEKDVQETMRNMQARNSRCECKKEPWIKIVFSKR